MVYEKIFINHYITIKKLFQLNRNTQYIDASHVYGSDKKTADGLRTFVNGKLRSRLLKNEEYCPQNPNSEFKDGPLGKSDVQFAAGN